MTGPSDADPSGRLVIRRAPGAGPRRLRDGAARSWSAEVDDDEPTPFDQRLRDLAPLGLWLVALVAAVGAFHALGRTPLASPPVTAPGDWWAWAQGRTTDELAFNVLRIVGVGLAWYLLGATTIGAVARLARLGGLVRFADRLTIGPVRRLLQASLGVALAAGATTALPGTAYERPAPISVEAAMEATSAHAPPVVPVVPGAIGQEVVDGRVPLRTEASLRASVPTGHDGWAHLLGGVAQRDLAPQTPLDVATTGDVRADADVAAAVRTSPSDGEVGAQRPANPAQTGVVEDAGTWTVRAGDHFWSIAEAVVASVGTDIGEDAVVEYWERLVEVNRDRLVAPGNVDLLLPGQVLVVPVVA